MDEISNISLPPPSELIFSFNQKIDFLAINWYYPWHPRRLTPSASGQWSMVINWPARISELSSLLIGCSNAINTDPPLIWASLKQIVVSSKLPSDTDLYVPHLNPDWWSGISFGCLSGRVDTMSIGGKRKDVRLLITIPLRKHSQFFINFLWSCWLLVLRSIQLLQGSQNHGHLYEKQNNWGAFYYVSPTS